ncbi:Hypp5225 [Branchiostoma lanceolatum]|uniref:Hypp5225 protein n=1 Tax=Branchiostoma lanceolatum TaxID=7740 RepID=A0A8K0AIX7_BRALA|nr:Hypp5225 [Branchiostoma lanceolatum]
MGICLGFFGFFLIGLGIMLTAIFAASGSGVVAVGATALGVGAVLLGVGLWLCNQQWKDNRAAGTQAQGQQGVNVISDATGTATVTTTTVNQDGQTVINMTAVPSHPAADWSNMTKELAINVFIHLINNA